jgi:hypothetical protein
MTDSDLPHDKPTAQAQKSARCSFCGKNYLEAGGLAEGPAAVYICFGCCLACANIIFEGYKNGVLKPPKT